METAHSDIKTPKVCIIGAGSSGIANCKILKENEIPFVCYEMGNSIGGMWSFKNSNGVSSAYRSLHINTSRDQMEYSDFPMPADYPDFPSVFKISEYFNSYVDHFGFRENIELETKVTHCERNSHGKWLVTIENKKGESQKETFDALVVANGHHWDPRLPEPAFEGEFNGTEIHSHHYIDPTDPIDCTDKNVVVVGMGNSAMDIACELGRQGVAKHVYLSCRSGVYVFPKYLGSKPLDSMLRHPCAKPSLWEHIQRNIPGTFFENLTKSLLYWILKRQVGLPQDYGLPKPKHAFGSTHPTISNEIHIRLGSGDVFPKPNINKLLGDQVEFADGTKVDADIIIYATGYNISFPFFDDTLIKANGNDIALYQRMMDPRFDNLFFLALVQPLCAMMPIAEQQSHWIAAHLKGDYKPPSPEQMAQEMKKDHERMKAKFTDSSRHTIEIDCAEYTYFLNKNLKQGIKRANAN